MFKDLVPTSQKTLRLCYGDQPFGAVQGNSCTLYTIQSYETLNVLCVETVDGFIFRVSMGHIVSAVFLKGLITIYIFQWYAAVTTARLRKVEFFMQS